MNKRRTARVDIELDSDQNVTRARVRTSLLAPGKTEPRPVFSRAFERVAIRVREDHENPDIGALLAVGRALSAAGARMVQIGNGLVKHADDIGVMKQQRPRLTREQVEERTRALKAMAERGRSKTTA